MRKVASRGYFFGEKRLSEKVCWPEAWHARRTWRIAWQCHQAFWTYLWTLGILNIRDDEKVESVKCFTGVLAWLAQIFVSMKCQ